MGFVRGVCSLLSVSGFRKSRRGSARRTRYVIDGTGSLDRFDASVQWRLCLLALSGVNDSQPEEGTMSSVEAPSENDEFSEYSRADLCQRIRDLEAANASLREENTTLKQLVAAYEQWIHDLKTHLKRYENPNTPPSKQGGAAWLSADDFLGEATGDDHIDTDGAESDAGDSADGGEYVFSPS